MTPGTTAINSSPLPLRLFEVLEQELANMHGREAHRTSWLLEATDVNFDALRDVLLHPARTKQGHALYTIGQRVVDAGVQLTGDRAATDERLLEALNQILQLREEPFPSYLLPVDDEVRQMAEVISTHSTAADEHDTPSDATSTSAAGQTAADTSSDLVKRNRLMLEAIVPASAIRRLDAVRLKDLFDAIHGVGCDPSPLLALCLSGGGIRSASFALGVLQGLARSGTISKVDYLSTVSGGGYIGGWLSSWISRHPLGLEGVVSDLEQTTRSGEREASRRIHPDPGPLRFLRSYSHFLNPRSGLFTLDTWTWVGLYLRNLMLSWLVLVPLLLLVVALPRLYGAFMFDTDFTHGDVFPTLIWVASLAVVFTIVSVTVNRPSISDLGRLQSSKYFSRTLWRVRQFLKQPRIVVATGIVPMCVFAVLLTLVFWGLTRAKQPFTLSQIIALVAGSPPRDILGLIPYFAIENMLVWGEVLIFIAWLVATLLVQFVDIKKRLKELLVMLMAGMPTWGLISLLADSAAAISTNNDSGVAVALKDLRLDSAHVYLVVAVPIAVAALLTGMTLFIGFVSRARWIDDEDREWWARFGACTLIFVVAWVSVSAIAMFGPTLLQNSPTLLAGLGGISGIIALVAGKSSLTSSGSQSKASTTFTFRNVLGSLGLTTLAAASLIFFAVLLAGLSLTLDFVLKASLFEASAARGDATVVSSLGKYLGMRDTFTVSCGHGAPWNGFAASSALSDPNVHLALFCQTSFRAIGALILVLIATIVGASLLINTNKFSLHAAYRLRIVRAFLGASRADDRRPNPFTGFDPFDNIQMHELQAGLVRESDFLDLPGFVADLRRALDHGTGTVHGWLASKMCSKENDPGGVLESRLRAADGDRPILVSLQRSLMQSLNRVLEIERLDAATELRAASASDPRVAKFIKRGELIFANRVILEKALPTAIRTYRFPPPPPHRFIHIVNLTLNLVRGKSLSWQERKAAPFSVTPMHSGSYYLGYRNSREYGGDDGISLGTAVAVSGAAVSPNMGYTSSPITALLLTFFNVRLGWWLGNPGVAGVDTYRRSGPRLSFRSIVAEALGLTDDQSPYVYLSDGGHFENLGLFEVVLRRCRLVIASDAGADPEYEFEDIGNAVRKIRIDLGIPIEFAKVAIGKYDRSKSEDASPKYCAIARIRYSAVDGAQAPDGVLILFKPTLNGTEPQDVLNYHAQNRVFPQESTGDQFFGESQFESYRQLGQHEISTTLGELGSTKGQREHMVDLVSKVARYLGVNEPWLQAWIAEVQPQPDLADDRSG